MSGEIKEGEVGFSEDDVIRIKVHLDRIRAVANSLITVDRNGYTDELCERTIHDLMGVIESQVEEARALLTY